MGNHHAVPVGVAVDDDDDHHGDHEDGDIACQ